MAREKENHTYTYNGPVTVFGVCVLRDWKTTTWAPSEKKALANLAYRYKKQQGLVASAKVELPGKLVKEID